MNGQQGTDAVIGDECHIVSARGKGPRHRVLSDAEFDSYDNLLLLCRNHHKMVDDQHETYTEVLLQRLKKNHEHWAATNLAVADERQETLRKLVKVRLLSTGGEVLDVVSAAHAFDFDHDQLQDEDEVALVGAFLQSAQDWGEMWDEIQVGEHVDARFQLDKRLKELRAGGFLVYGALNRRSIQVGGKRLDDWQVATLRVLRINNPNVPSHHRDIDGPPSDA